MIVSNRNSGTVIGYHGCRTNASRTFAEELFADPTKIREWRSSENDYDWLGSRIYFWEDSPTRALKWSEESGTSPVVIGALIDLGRCFDLTDPDHMDHLGSVYKTVAEKYRDQKRQLPTNRGRAFGLRDLDCPIVNEAMKMSDQSFGDVDHELYFQSVRCPFEEGEAAFPGGMIRTLTHIQIAIRNWRCIRAVFRVL